jgi:hypothetical protein
VERLVRNLLTLARFGGLLLESIRRTRSACNGDTPRMRAVSRRLGKGVLIVTRYLMLFGHFPFQPVSHLMRVEADRTPNAEKWDPVVFYFFVHGSYGDTKQISQFFYREGLVFRTQPLGRGHYRGPRKSRMQRTSTIARDSGSVGIRVEFGV